MIKLSPNAIYCEAYEAGPGVLGPDLCVPGPTSAHAKRSRSRLIFVEPKAADKVDRRGAARRRSELLSCSRARFGTKEASLNWHH